METLERLEKIVGTLTRTTKMPCYSFDISAKECKLGSILRKQKGTVCSKCYAFGYNYRWPAVKKQQAQRLKAWKTNPFWKYYMMKLISYKSEGYFRWFSSGDLQSVKMLTDIIWIARALPNIKFWLPTREIGFVREYLAKNKEFPTNLTVRISSPMIGQGPLDIGPGVCYSTVGYDNKKEVFQCEASLRENKCGPCRSCFYKHEKIVNYPLH